MGDSPKWENLMKPIHVYSKVKRRKKKSQFHFTLK